MNKRTSSRDPKPRASSGLAEGSTVITRRKGIRRALTHHIESDSKGMVQYLTPARAQAPIRLRVNLPKGPPSTPKSGNLEAAYFGGPGRFLHIRRIANGRFASAHDEIPPT